MVPVAMRQVWHDMTKAKRLYNWESRYDEFLLDSLRRSMPAVQDPLVWSWNPVKGHNCATWVSEGIEKIIGFNIFREFLSHYNFGGPKGAIQAITDVWGTYTFEDMWRLLFDEVPLVKAQKGDIGLIKSEDAHSKEMGFKYACGMLSDPYLYVMQPEGVIRYPRSDIVMTFSVDSYELPHRQDGGYK